MSAPACSQRVLANEPRFASVPPARIVPMLADEGVYLASESSFARVLRADGQNAHRGRAKAPKAVRPPTTHIASAPGQVWCWDMTYLPAIVMGFWFHLYLILDLYSRKIVGWEVHASDHSDHAVHLVRRTALAEGIALIIQKDWSTEQAVAVLDGPRQLSWPPGDNYPGRWRWGDVWVVSVVFLSCLEAPFQWLFGKRKRVRP